MSEFVRLVDIANKVGVTVNTVSRALNGKPGVAEQTRDLIKRAADEMGYQPNIMARSLRGYSPNIIGVILLNCINPFLAGVLRSIDERASALGYNILMFNIERNNSRTIEAIKVLTGIRAKGIIMQPSAMTDGIEREIEAANLPFVIYGYASGYVKADFIRSNDELGGYLMMKHLIAKGYETITFLKQKNGLQAFHERLRSARRAAAEAGFDEAGFKLELIETIDSAYCHVRRMYEEGRLPRCFFCANDYLAVDTLASLRDCGIAVPGQVAVAGYDGSPGRHACYMPLTTMYSDYREIGQMCVEMLHKRISGKCDGYQSVVIDPKVEDGASA